MHGGTVDAASDGEGKGATFRVRLPLMIVHDAVAREPREHPRTETLAPLKGLKNLMGIRVMAIDDEEDALGLLRVVLEAAGAEVVTMSSASDALQRLADAKPDVMVVDLGMPQMDGFEFIARIRASSDRGYPGHSSRCAHRVCKVGGSDQGARAVVSKCISRSL